MTEEKKGYWNPVNVMVWTYALTFGYSAGDRLLIAMLFPFVIPYFGLDYTHAGLIMMSMAAGYLVLAFAGGIISDKVGRKKVLLPSALVFSLASGITGFAGNVGQLIAARTIVGAAEGSFNSAAAAQIGEESPPEKRGINMGIYVSMFALFGSFIAPIYATQVATLWGWQMACFLTVIPGVVLAWFISTRIKESIRFSKPLEKSKVSWQEIMKERNIWLSFFVCSLWFIWLWSWLSFGIVYFVNVRGFSPGTAGFLQSALGAGGFVGMIFLPWLSDCYGRKLPLQIGTIIGFIGTSAILFIPTTSAFAIWAMFFVTAITTWGICPIILNVIPSESVPVERAALAIGTVVSIGELAGIAVAPPILGAIGDHFGLTSALFLGAACLIPVCILSFFFRETAPCIVKAKQPVAEVQA